MTYQIKGANVTLFLSAEEIGEVVDALELCDPGSEVLAALKEYRQEEFA
jgi:hypothetical protein